jgi:hypothetical protein
LDPDSLSDPWDIDVSNSEIKEGMSPDEIAEIMSDRLIRIVREHFKNFPKINGIDFSKA